MMSQSRFFLGVSLFTTFFFIFKILFLTDSPRNQCDFNSLFNIPLGKRNKTSKSILTVLRLYWSHCDFNVIPAHTMQVFQYIKAVHNLC